MRGANGWEGCQRCSSTGFLPSRRRIKRLCDGRTTSLSGSDKPAYESGCFGDVPCKSCGAMGVSRCQRKSKEPTGQVLEIEASDLNKKRTRPFDGSVSFQPKVKVNVVIVGGGIGGMALALALQQRNISCSVWEKDDRFESRPQGYGLTLQQAATTLKRLGFTNLKEFGISSVAHTSYLPSGEVVNEYGRMIHSTTRIHNGTRGEKGDAQRFNVHVPRQVLRKMLLDALNPDTVRWGYSIEDFETVTESNETSLRAKFSGPSGSEIAYGDLLVGADGIWSRVRGLALGESDLRYLGVMVILGRAPCSHELAVDRVFQTLGGVTRFYAMPFEKNITMWQLSFRISLEEASRLREAGSKVLLEEAIARCGAWHSPIPDILRETLAEDVTGYPAYDRDPPREFSALRGCKSKDSNFLPVILIGDASHPMSMFRGQGANQALLDAWNLAKCIASHENLPEAVLKFDAEMVCRVRPKVEKSSQAAVVLHTQESVAYRKSCKVT